MTIVAGDDFNKEPARAIGFVHVYDKGEVDSQLVRYDEFVRKLFKQMSPEMMKAHVAMGVAGEAGELCDAIKKEVIYGKDVDLENIIEELGDLRFYIQAVCNLYNIPEQLVLQHNANKLAKRYVGLAYTDQAAISRADKVVEDKPKSIEVSVIDVIVSSNSRSKQLLINGKPLQEWADANNISHEVLLKIGSAWSTKPPGVDKIIYRITKEI